MILDTLEQAVGLLIRRAIAKPKWSPHLLDTELEEVERHCEEVLEAAVRMDRDTIQTVPVVPVPLLRQGYLYLYRIVTFNSLFRDLALDLAVISSRQWTLLFGA